MIRPATLADIPALVEMGAAFLREDHFKGAMAIEPVALSEYMRRMVESPDADVLMSQHGMIGVQCCLHPMSGERVASEAFWYVTIGHRNGLGRQLMHSAERWAKAKGARRFQMSAPDTRVGVVLRRQGFRPLETTYQKDL